MNQGNFSLVDNSTVTSSYIRHFLRPPPCLCFSIFFRKLSCGKLSLIMFPHLEVIATLPLNGEEINPWHAVPEKYAKHFIYIAILCSPYLNPLAEVLLTLC